MKSLSETRKETAKKLSEETGFDIEWRGHCFTLWDGQFLRFPLYTVAQVLNLAGILSKTKKK